MRLPRFVHHAYAYLFGYFWLPCPICGRMFGGHEAGGNLWRPGGTTGRVVCRKHPGNYYGWEPTGTWYDEVAP